MAKRYTGQGNLTDVHCHLLPYVDDGAEDMETALDLLHEQAMQGVRNIILTPHRRTEMFETSADKIQMQYRRLRQLAAEKEPLLRLLLGREYFYDRYFCELMQEEPLETLGGSRFVLVEFSHRHSLWNLLQAVRQLEKADYQPVIAHIERYPAARENQNAVRSLIEQGAWIQMNAGAILGKEGVRQKLYCARLLREGLVHLVASDAHNMWLRGPNLGDCAAFLEKKYGEQTANQILLNNPGRILQEAKQESEVAIP